MTSPYEASSLHTFLFQPLSFCRGRGEFTSTQSPNQSVDAILSPNPIYHAIPTSDSSWKLKNQTEKMSAMKMMLVLALFLNLISSSQQWSGMRLRSSEEKAQSIPPTCERIECPSYDVIEQGNGYEIRRYNSSVWISTPPILDISLVEATRAGFHLLFDYIQGKNYYKKKLDMTGPVITEVSPSDGPFCESSFVVSFYVPKENQANPPPADGLHIQRWDTTYVAVRQFGGFVSDYKVAEEAAALQANLAGSKWAVAVAKRSGSSSYTVAQYNSPFEFENRVNQIWISYDIKDVAAAHE